MPHLPDSLNIILPLLLLTAIPVIVHFRGQRQLREAMPPRAQVDPELREPPSRDDWLGFTSAHTMPGAPPLGPRPYDWRTRVPARLLEPGRRPRSGRC